MARKKLVEVKNESLVEVKGFSVDLYDSFLKYVDVSPKSASTYKRNLKAFFRYIANNKVSQPTRETVIDFRNYLKENYKPSTVQAYITVAKLFFQWTEMNGLYPDIAKHIKGAKVETTHKKDCLTLEQVQKVLKEASADTSERGRRDFAILTLMLTCGLRTIEITRIDIDDIGCVDGVSVLYVQGKGKEEKSDMVKLPVEVVKAISDYKAVRNSTRGSKNSKALFTSTNRNRGQRLTTRTISGIVKNLFVKCGYDSPKLTAHSTRHTAVTLALKNGATLDLVQSFARHKNIGTTLIYAHHLDSLKNECSTGIANLIFNDGKET